MWGIKKAKMGSYARLDWEGLQPKELHASFGERLPNHGKPPSKKRKAMAKP